MTKPALQVEPNYRSSLEKKIAAQLETEGLDFEYEKTKLKYLVPAKEHTYTPDFKIATVFIEAKGAFGYGRGGFNGDPVKQRQKLLLIAAQHPDIDLRIVFERANTKIYKGSPTTYGAWATANGFKWADKGTIPAEWIKEMKEQQNG